MGFWSSVWEGVKSVGRTVSRVVKKVYEVCTDTKAVEAYDRLERVINQHQQSKYEENTRAPDFFGEVSTTNVERQLSEQNSKLVAHERQINHAKQLTALQIEFTRLRASASLIDRSMKNVKIHASSLSVHNQNMRNISGLVEEVNTLRYGLKAAISTINYNANLLAKDGTKPRKIEGIDLEKKDGAISMVAAYDSFDRTRELLRNEVVELSELASSHLQEIDKLKHNAANLGGELGDSIIRFVDRDIVPIIKQAESAGLILKSEVLKLPAAVREDNGSLVFEDGKIKLEHLH